MAAVLAWIYVHITVSMHVGSAVFRHHCFHRCPVSSWYFFPIDSVIDDMYQFCTNLRFCLNKNCSYIFNSTVLVKGKICIKSPRHTSVQHQQNEMLCQSFENLLWTLESPGWWPFPLAVKSLPFDGYALGGSFGKLGDEMVDLVEFVIPQVRLRCLASNWVTYPSDNRAIVVKVNEICDLTGVSEDVWQVNPRCKGMNRWAVWLVHWSHFFVPMTWQGH